MRLFWGVILASTLLSSCFVHRQRRSSDFYIENQAAIDCLIEQYHEIYEKQPFAIGFADRRYKHFTLQMYTDSVRYIYNTKLNRQLIFTEILNSNLNNDELRLLARQLRNLECLWIDKKEIYIDGKKAIATHLSFKSQLFNKPFEENKYYILAFVNSPLPTSSTRGKLRKMGYHEINKYVYFTIASKFR